MRDYVELVVTAAQISGDVDAANYSATLLNIAESKLSRRLQTHHATQTVERTTSDEGVLVLPRDFTDMVHVFVNKKELVPVPLRSIITGDREGYALKGRELHSCHGEAKHEITYYQALPSLEEEGCNWLLEEAPDIYLQALLLELAIKNRQVDIAAETSSYLDLLIDQFLRKERKVVITASRPGGPRP